GLTGLVRTLGLQDRAEPMTLHGPRGAERVLGGRLAGGGEKNRFPGEFGEDRAGDRLRRCDYDLLVVQTDHRADTVGYALAEHDRLGRFHPERARELGVPEGPLWGRLHRGEAVELPDGRRVGPADLVGPTRPGRRVVISGDTRPAPALVEAA